MRPDRLDLTGEAPTPERFFVELSLQILHDLDGVLSMDEGVQACTDAARLVRSALSAGGVRGASLIVLADAALAAYPALIGAPAAGRWPHRPDEAVASALIALEPGAAAQLQGLRAQADWLRRKLGADALQPTTTHEFLAGAIHRLYAGLGASDPAETHRSLVELHAMLVHLDACAVSAQRGASLRDCRSIRPDRFHDLYIAYVDAVQRGDQTQTPVATLRQDGRIAALITTSSHPIASAEAEVREHFGDDVVSADGACLRLRALVRFVETLHRAPQPGMPSPEDTAGLLSLVTAAATAPLRQDGRFGLAEIAQIARYNLTLLRPATTAPAH